MIKPFGDEQAGSCGCLLRRTTEGIARRLDPGEGLHPDAGKDSQEHAVCQNQRADDHVRRAEQAARLYFEVSFAIGVLQVETIGFRFGHLKDGVSRSFATETRTPCASLDFRSATQQ